jgi:amino acid transporter
LTAPSGPEHGHQPTLIRAIGRWSLTAAIVNGVIGSGIFGLPSSVAALTGAWSPLAVLIAGAGVFLVLLCFAEVGSRFDQAGGPYLYAREAFGPIVGFQVGWLLIANRLLGCAAALNILIVYLTPVVPAVGTPVGRMLTMIGAMTLTTAINVRGVETAAWTTNVFTVAKLLPLGLLIVVGLPVRFAPTCSPRKPSFNQRGVRRFCCWCLPLGDSSRTSSPRARRAILGGTPRLRSSLPASW